MAEMLDYIQLMFILLLSTYAIRAILTRKRNKDHLRTPPTPIALPIIGHFHLLSKLPHQSFHNLSIHYGPIIQLFLGSIPCILTSSPEIAKEFLKTHEAFFLDRWINIAIHYLSYGSKGFLFAPNGDNWKFMRKICMLELLGGKTLDQLRPKRRQETLRFLRHLQKKGEIGEVVDVGDELLTLTIGVITRMTLSKPCDVDDIRNIVQEGLELIGKFHLSDFILCFKNRNMRRISRRVKRAMDRFDTMMERLIKDHQEEKKKRSENGEGFDAKDLLDILLEIHENDNTEIKLTKENVKAFIWDIFMTGADSSAVTTEWALAELINNPHVMEKVRKEIDSITENKSLIQESDIPKLPYLQAIVKETLRIHPAIPILVRQSSNICNVIGFEIPKKSLLLVNLWSMGRDPKLWENPLEFRPERFMSEENRFDVKGHNFELLPFGTGRRICPGASLALQAIPTYLGALIQCFEWNVNGNVNMEEKSATTVQRAHPLLCVPVPRFNCFSLCE